MSKLQLSSAMPARKRFAAILRAFLERIFQPDLLEPGRQSQVIKPLEGKSARVIVTMRMLGFVYRRYFGAHALTVLKRNILEFVRIFPCAR